MSGTVFYIPTQTTGGSTNLSGDVLGTSSSNYIPDITVTSKLLTGLVSTPGTVTAADSIRSAIGKLSAGALAVVANSIESAGTTLNIATQNNTQTVNIGSGTGVQTINVGNSGVGATAINIGGGTDSVNIVKANFANTVAFPNAEARKRISLFDEGTPSDQTDHRFNGIGKGFFTQVYQVKTTAENHSFCAATSATTSNELLRIAGTGAVSCGGSLTAGSLIAPSLTFPSGTLSYYEEYDHVTAFNLSTITSANVTIKFTRVGRKVTAHVPLVTMTNAATLSPGPTLVSTVAFPARFRSTAACIAFVSVNNDQLTPASSVGCANITAAGMIEIRPTTAVSAYTVNGAYNFGFASFTATWTV